MPSASAKLVPAILVPFFAWRIYRRFQRNVGQQPLRPRRLITGIVVFSLVTLGIVALTLRMPSVLAGYGGGLVAGLALAFVGLHLTKFETNEKGHFYTPNTYIGVGLSLLLAGRVAYRFGMLFFSDNVTLVGNPGPAMFQSALTLFILGLTAGYFLTYNSGVLIKGGDRSGAKR